LAERTQSKAAGDALDQLISFAIGDEDYGVDIQTVEQAVVERPEQERGEPAFGGTGYKKSEHRNILW